MLLAVLDEGRLTDALGRTADFTNAVLVLTSNLGVREAASQLGFKAATRQDADQDADFVSAAEKFSRPEFFNRLDRVVPFRSLTLSDLRLLVHRLLFEDCELAENTWRRAKYRPYQPPPPADYRGNGMLQPSTRVPLGDRAVAIVRVNSHRCAIHPPPI